MRLRFEPDLDYQQDAIAAVCDLFQGQETCRTEFTVSHNLRDQLPGFQEGELGVGNRLQLPDEALLANLKRVQMRNGLFPAGSLASRDFTVEMETGTRQDLRISADDFRAQPSVRVHEVRHRGAVGGHQGRGQQVAGHHGTAPSRAVFGHAVRALRVRLHEAGTGSELRHQPASADHGGDRRRHQQARRQQHLPAEREDRRREAHRPGAGHQPGADRGRAAKRGRRPEGAGDEGRWR